MNRLESSGDQSTPAPSYFSLPFSLAVSVPVTDLLTLASPRAAPTSLSSFASIQLIHSPTLPDQQQAAMVVDPTGRYKGNNYDPLYHQKRQQRSSQTGGGPRDGPRRHQTDLNRTGHRAEQLGRQNGERPPGGSTKHPSGPAQPGRPDAPRTAVALVNTSGTSKIVAAGPTTTHGSPTGSAPESGVTRKKQDREKEPGEIDSEPGSATFRPETSSPLSSIRPAPLVQIATPRSLITNRSESLDLSKTAHMLNTPEKQGQDRATSLPLLSPLTDLERLRKFKAEVEASRLRNVGKSTPSLTSMAQSFLQSQLPFANALAAGETGDNAGAADDSSAQRREQELKERLLNSRQRTTPSTEGGSLRSHAAEDLFPKTLKRSANPVPDEVVDLSSKRAKLDDTARDRENLIKSRDVTDAALNDRAQNSPQGQAKVRKRPAKSKTKLNLQPSATNFVPARFQRRSGDPSNDPQLGYRRPVAAREEAPLRRNAPATIYGGGSRNRPDYDDRRIERGQEPAYSHRRPSYDSRYPSNLSPRAQAADSRTRARAPAPWSGRRPSADRVDPVVGGGQQGAYNGAERSGHPSNYVSVREGQSSVPTVSRDAVRPLNLHPELSVDRRAGHVPWEPHRRGSRTSGSQIPSNGDPAPDQTAPVPTPTEDQRQVMEAINVLKAQIANLERLVPSLTLPSPAAPALVAATSHPIIQDSSWPDSLDNRRDHQAPAIRDSEEDQQPIIQRYKGPGQYRDPPPLERRNFVTRRRTHTPPEVARVIPRHDERYDDRSINASTRKSSQLEAYDRAPPAYRRESFEVLEQRSRISPTSQVYERRQQGHPAPYDPHPISAANGERRGSDDRGSWARGKGYDSERDRSHHGRGAAEITRRMGVSARGVFRE